MSETCNHENVVEIGDMPIAAPVTFEFLGRFDVTQCNDCHEILSQEPTVYPPPSELNQPLV